MEHRGKEQAAVVPKDENETYLRLAKLSSGGPAELGSVGPKMPCRYPVFSLQPRFYCGSLRVDFSLVSPCSILKQRVDPKQ